MNRPKFLIDRMLGKLVAWLRIFDYDTLSALELRIECDEDNYLIRVASEEGRVLLSRDRVLVGRATKVGVTALLISPNDVKGQICELMKHYSIITEPIMKRCTMCNSGLRPADPLDLDKAGSDVPRHLIDEGKKFWACDGCGKIYWTGSHWRNIQKTAREMENCKHINQEHDNRSRLR